MNTARSQLNRRSAIKLGLTAGAAVTLDGLTLAADEAAAAPLITKAIPSSGKKIPVIGLGTNQYGVSTEE